MGVAEEVFSLYRCCSRECVGGGGAEFFSLYRCYSGGGGGDQEVFSCIAAVAGSVCLWFSPFIAAVAGSVCVCGGGGGVGFLLLSVL